MVRQNDGTAYTVDWAALDGLTRNRILESAKGARAFGARVSVTGAPIRIAAEIRGFFPDFKGEVNPRTIDPWLIRQNPSRPDTHRDIYPGNIDIWYFTRVYCRT